MWDSGNQLGDASGPTKRVLSCAFRLSRPFRVVTASEDFGVAHFKGPPLKFDKTPHRHQNYVNCVRTTPTVPVRHRRVGRRRAREDRGRARGEDPGKGRRRRDG